MYVSGLKSFSFFKISRTQIRFFWLLLLVMGLTLDSHQNAACQQPECSQVIQGQVVEWSVTGKPRASAEYRLKPAGHGLLHVETQGEETRLIYVAMRTGNVAITNTLNRVIRRFDVKPWPNQPVSGGIKAGAGDFSAQWQPINQAPQAGEVVKLGLTVTGHASLAITQPPKITVTTPAGPEPAILSKAETVWPGPGRTAYRSWCYEFLSPQAGAYRVSPLIFHLHDEKTGQVLAKLVPGPSWSTAVRALFLAQNEAEPTTKRPYAGGLVIIPLIFAAFLLMTLLVVFRHHIILWGLNYRLSKSRQPLSPPMAQKIFRRYEPILADVARARRKKMPAIFGQVRRKLRAVEAVAFGRPGA